jgi:hypothetical protein
MRMAFSIMYQRSIKATDDSLHQEIFARNKLHVYLYLHKGSSCEAETKNVANMVIKAAVTTMKRPSRRESQAVQLGYDWHCHDLLRQVLSRLRLYIYYIHVLSNYLVAKLVPKLIDPPTALGKATCIQKKVIYTKCNDQAFDQHSCLAAFWQVAFKFTPIR